MINPGEASDELQRRTLVQLIKEERVEEARQFLARAPDPRALAQAKSPESLQPPLFQAVQLKGAGKAVEMVRALLELDVPVSPVDSYGQTPLFYLCRDGNTELLALFLERGADINQEDSFKQTPLFYASKEGHEEFVRQMIEHGAEVDHFDKIRETPLFYAARDGKQETCRVLIEAGANVNTIDDKKQTPLYFAMKSNNAAIVEFLVAQGAIRTRDGRITKNEQVKLQRREADGDEENATPQKPANNANKKKKAGAVEEQRLAYRLVYTDAELKTRELSEADFLRLAELCPQLCRVLQNPELLASDERVQEAIAREKWQQGATTTIDTLRKHKSARVFNDPVDWVKLKIPDYPRLIQTPMDFGTIKKKLGLNVYRDVHEFVNDMNLVFSNCKLYNGTESVVGKMGVEVQREWEVLLKSLSLVEKFGNETQNSYALDPAAQLDGFFDGLNSTEATNQPPSAQKNESLTNIS